MSDKVPPRTPFGGPSERTIIRPNPGGRRPVAPPQPAGRAAARLHAGSTAERHWSTAAGNPSGDALCAAERAGEIPIPTNGSHRRSAASGAQRFGAGA